MCGICGAVDVRGAGAEVAPERVAAMAEALAHRGPDERRTWSGPGVGLGHTRLSIIDLAGGRQPMASADGALVVAFNGEIYNYLELTEELRAAGHRFETRSDTEVLLHAYEQWGPDCVRRYNGQFAFALWDAPRRRLLLARDRAGIRPLFYIPSTADGLLAFGSEVKALVAGGFDVGGLDPRGLAQTLVFWGTVAPRSPFGRVAQVRPGHMLLADRGGLSERPYWSADHRLSERWRRQLRLERGADGAPPLPAAAQLDADPVQAEAAEALHEHLQRATRLRLRADVPVGAYLSGGLDSSVTAGLAAQAVGGRLRTFSIRFDDAAYDEGAFQQAMVQRLGTEHAEVRCSSEDIARVFPDVVRHAEAPLLRTAPAPMFILSGLVRQSGFKVVLTGEGADEVLAGYDLFREAKVRRFWARDPGSSYRPLLLHRLYPWMARSPGELPAFTKLFYARGLDRPTSPDFAHGPRWSNGRRLLGLLTPELREAAARGGPDPYDPVEELCADLPADFDTWGPLGRDQYLEVRTLLQSYILSSQGDRMGMAHSIEGRFPFLDPELVDFCDGLPPRLKLHGLDEKHLLKVVAQRLVPLQVLSRPKQPYRAPDSRVFFGAEGRRYVDDALAPAAVAAAGLFDPARVEGLRRKVAAAAARPRAQARLSNADDQAFVAVLSAQLLAQQLG